jgi:hypothetical protein
MHESKAERNSCRGTNARGAAGNVLDPRACKRIAALDTLIVGSTPEQFSAYLKSELAKFERG